MATLGRVEHQGASECLEDVARGAADPSLLKANDVVDADVRELGKLLAAQAGHTPPNAGIEADELR
jgi:hypothetical protein